MTTTKMEFVFIERLDESGFRVLGDFSGEGVALLGFPIGAIGEMQTVDLDKKQFSGRIVDKTLSYAQKDLEGIFWNLVVRVTITLELSSGGPDPRYDKVNQSKL